MPLITLTSDAIYLGDSATTLNSGAAGNAFEGLYDVPGGTDSGTSRLATLANLTITADNQGFGDFEVGRNGALGTGMAEEGGATQNVTYIDQVQVTFTFSGGATRQVNMLVVQLADGSVYMTEENRDLGSFPTVAGQELVSFSVGNLGSSQSGAYFSNSSTFTDRGFPVCFVAGTMIMTDAGEVAVETLKQGDLVMTMDNGLQEVRWMGVQTMSAAALNGAKNLRPVRIKAGALGDGMPQSDLLVSQQHRMLVRSGIAQKMFGEDEVLVAAKHLVLLDGVDIVDDADGVTYVHFLCAQHEVVFANGAPSETLYTGPEALKSVSPAARAEILAIFPEVADIDYKALSARTFVNGRKGRQLAVRHKNNNRPLLDLH